MQKISSVGAFYLHHHKVIKFSANTPKGLITASTPSIWALHVLKIFPNASLVAQKPVIDTDWVEMSLNHLRFKFKA